MAAVMTAIGSNPEVFGREETNVGGAALRAT
jgi:hypothetical protein